MDKKKIAVPLVCHGHSRPVVDLFYSPVTPDGFFLISASKDSSPMLRNGETGDWIGTFEGHKGAVWSVCLDTNALRAASASADFSAKVWDALTGDVLHSFEHKHIVRACAFSEVKLVLSIILSLVVKQLSRLLWLSLLTCERYRQAEILSADKAIRVDSWYHHLGMENHKYRNSELTRAVLSEYEVIVMVELGIIAKLQDTHLLLTGGVEKVLRIYDLNRPDAPPREVDKSPGSVRTVTWMHSDQTILSSCTDMGGVRYSFPSMFGGSLILWDVRSGKIVQTLETKSSVTSAEVSQDGRYITTADGSTVKFWDANHYGLVKSYNMPCTVESASLEPKYGNKFVAGGEDMWVRVFDFHTGDEIACNKGHHGPVHCVRFSPGGESYASGSEDGTIRIWLTGPLTHDGTEPFAANGSVGKVKVTAEDVSRKIEGFQIAEEGKTKEKETGKE
ncbi:serine-threonine kinase receptor-associated protein-like [Gossypium australe]|uniref:Serine-threonine kinase receptor-associated protein n=2 Tax=Gossypium TaxID=3633 RepID=A0A5B6X7K0_9ROSI|nr:serine-threonine kinase receptor-associated protein-like [Gossypium australe]